MPNTQKTAKAIENSHYLEIISRLESLAVEQKEIRDEQKKTNERLARREHLDQMVMDHQEAIKGNGKPGLEQRMAITEEREAKRDRREWFIYTLLFTELVGIALIFFQG